jgi:hypothetical protein
VVVLTNAKIGMMAAVETGTPNAKVAVALVEEVIATDVA